MCPLKSPRWPTRHHFHVHRKVTEVCTETHDRPGESLSHPESTLSRASQPWDTFVRSPQRPGDRASSLSPGSRGGCIYVCVSPFGICFVLFCLVLFFWGNKGPFCGPSGRPASRWESGWGREGNVASRWNAALLCTCLLQLKVSRCLEVPQLEACSQDRHERLAASTPGELGLRPCHRIGPQHPPRTKTVLNIQDVKRYLEN